MVVHRQLEYIQSICRKIWKGSWLKGEKMDLFWANNYVIYIFIIVLKITVSLLNGLTYLHEENTFHG